MPNKDLNPQSGVGGDSYLYDFGTTPNTRTAVSQKVRILTPHFGDATAMHQMGVVSTFNPTESRAIEPVRGVGFGDQVAEQVPGVTEPMTGSFERALLYLCNLWQATGYAAGISGPVRSLKHHKWPFDIEQQLVFSTLADVDLGVANQGLDGANFQGGVKRVEFPHVTTAGGQQPSPNEGHTAIITIYEACWFTSWSASFAKDAGVIMESGDVSVSDVHDFSSVYGEFLNTGNDPTRGELGSIRFAESSSTFGVAGVGGGAIGSAEQSLGFTASTAG